MAFGITTDLSQKPAFNEAVGFTRADALRAISDCVGYAEGSPESTAILATLTRWCDGYLFAAELDAIEGMYQSGMVVQLLDAVLARRDKTTASLLGFLVGWAPTSDLVAVVRDRKLLDYYAPSAAMATLLPKLVSGRPLAVPTPLTELSVIDQVLAAAVDAPSARGSKATDLEALASTTGTLDVAVPIDLTDAENTIVRTLLYDGILTHAPGHVNGLRVSNDFVQQLFVDKFCPAPRDCDTPLQNLKAAENFILGGSTEALEAALCTPAALARRIQVA